MSSVSDFIAELQDIGDRFVAAIQKDPLIRRFATGAVTREEYVTFLQQVYHYVKATTPNLAAAAWSVREDPKPGNVVLANRLAEHAEEETGHHFWILDDLEALGAPREEIERVPICRPIQAYLAYFGHIANSRHAAGLFGQAYVLEGGAVRSADLMIKALVERSGIPNIRNAVSFFERHGIVDVDHVNELMHILEYVTDPEDQRSAVMCAEVTAQLWLDVAEYVARVTRVAVNGRYAGVSERIAVAS